MEKLCIQLPLLWNEFQIYYFWIYYLLFRFDLHLKLTLQKEYKSKTHYLLSVVVNFLGTYPTPYTTEVYGIYK